MLDGWERGWGWGEGISMTFIRPAFDNPFVYNFLVVESEPALSGLIVCVIFAAYLFAREDIHSQG
jgi:hypothetical protein